MREWYVSRIPICKRQQHIFLFEKRKMSKMNVDFSNLRTASQIRAAFEALRLEEDATEQELDNLLSSHRFIDTELKELLQSGQFHLGKCENDVQEMSRRIGYTASLADGVSVKVKQLDLAKVILELKSKYFRTIEQKNKKLRFRVEFTIANSVSMI